MKPAMTPQQALLTTDQRSSLELYRELVADGSSIWRFVYFELCTLFLSGLPGLPGLGLRSLVYPTLFEHCGKRPAFGKGVLVRNPQRISVGNKLLADDYSVLDVHGAGGRIELADHVCIGRFATLAAKGGVIQLQGGVNVGSYCRLATQSRLEIGASTLIAAFSYIGPGNHKRTDTTRPLIEQEMDVKGGVKIGEHCWIGAHTTIVDGVSIGDGAIVGAHSFVRSDVPAGAVVAGVPARQL